MKETELLSHGLKEREGQRRFWCRWCRLRIWENLKHFGGDRVIQKPQKLKLLFMKRKGDGKLNNYEVNKLRKNYTDLP